MMLKNVWLDEIRVSELVEYLSGELATLFAGQPKDAAGWHDCFFHLLYASGCHQRIRDIVLTRYQLSYRLDAAGRVTSLFLEKWPWYV